jgi:hypothetical protein
MKTLKEVAKESLKVVALALLPGSVITIPIYFYAKFKKKKAQEKLEPSKNSDWGIED